MLRLVEGDIVPAAGVLWGLYSSFDTSWIILADTSVRIITFGFLEVLTNLLIQVEQDYGIPIYLGEHVDVQYSLHSNPQAMNQELKSLWTRSTSPEILEADSSSNVYLHKVKFVQYGERQEAVQLHRVE